jgi:photosystem II stability/assembly factor-like uncharacterized protein
MLTAESRTGSSKAVHPPMWAISAAGTLQRSMDNGSTWQELALHVGARLRAVSAVENEIWIGTFGGALYHSSDAGQHWTRVVPFSGGTQMQGDVIGIEFADASHGSVQTSTGNRWTTTDGGRTWHFQ